MWDFLCILGGWQHPQHSQGELPRGFSVELPRSGLCLLYQFLDWCARWLWQIAGASHSCTSLTLVRSSNQPVWLHFCFTYLSASVLMIPHYWCYWNLATVIKRKTQFDTKVSKCWLGVCFCWVGETLVMIRRGGGFEVTVNFLFLRFPWLKLFRREREDCMPSSSLQRIQLGRTVYPGSYLLSHHDY